MSEPEVRAILQVRCVVCHGKSRQEGGLDLRMLASHLKGGKSGPAVVPGKPDESLLYKRREQARFHLRLDGQDWIQGGGRPLHLLLAFERHGLKERFSDQFPARVVKEIIA